MRPVPYFVLDVLERFGQSTYSSAQIVYRTVGERARPEHSKLALRVLVLEIPALKIGARPLCAEEKSHNHHLWFSSSLNMEIYICKLICEKLLTLPHPINKQYLLAEKYPRGKMTFSR